MYPVFVNTWHRDFKREWKKWLRLSTIVNAPILYEAFDTMYFKPCQRCQP